MSKLKIFYRADKTQCKDLVKVKDEINIGIGYANHMIDQINSHAQIGIAIIILDNELNYDVVDKINRYSNVSEQEQERIMSLLGSEVGKLLKALVPKEASESRFCCPLDEALVECIIRKSQEEPGNLSCFTLDPYGIFPKPNGRKKIGELFTSTIKPFFSSLAEEMNIQLSLRKISGDNAHHIVESSFKAFSRALRNYIDGINTTSLSDKASLVIMDQMWGLTSESHFLGLELKRSAEHRRTTKETSIHVELKLDQEESRISIDTGLKTLDHMITNIAAEAQVSLCIKCKGDLHIDDHHTTEDVAIAFGQVLHKALGNKAGLNRMWTSSSKNIEVVMDLSNRPTLIENLNLYEEEMLGDVSVEMIHHFLFSFVMNSQMTVHIVQHEKDMKIDEIVEGTTMALGKVLRMCIAIDPRRAGVVASSKGTLSV